MTLTTPPAQRNFLTIAPLAAVCLLLAGSALANTVTVTNLADSGPGSLRYAISSVANNGNIVFQFGLTGTITLTSGELAIGRNLTITGPGATNLTINGNGTGRVFNINSTNATVTIANLTISGGSITGSSNSPGEGGGILNSGSLTLVGCTVSGNRVTGSGSADANGGGIFSSGALQLSDCLISANVANGVVGFSEEGESASGGGIFIQGGSLANVYACSLMNCSVWNNFAGGGDGNAILNRSGDGSGGGIYVASVGVSNAVQLINCTISGNTTAGGSYFKGGGGSASGGGIFVGDTPFSIVSCTLCSNSSEAGSGEEGNGVAHGGGIACSAQPSVRNTIISGNMVGVLGQGTDGTSGPDAYGNVTSQGFNFISEADGSSGWVASDLTGTTNAPLDPQIGPLQDNGGPTPTMALLPGSAAIDQGYSFEQTTDQRGQPRPFRYFPNLALPSGGDGSDIGAFELVPPRLFIFPQLGLSWTEGSPGLTGPINRPGFGLESLAAGGPITPGQWTDFKNPVRRMMNNRYVAKDQIAAGVGTLYRLNTAAANTFIIPAATTAATSITSSNATLNGTTTPFGANTLYWFTFGLDTNYGLTTATNPLTTTTNPADVSSLSQPISGLNPLTAYHFQLVVTDDDGTQLGGDQSFTTASVASAAPAVVTMSATSIGTTSAHLNGTVNPEGGATVAWFFWNTTNFTDETSPLSVGSDTNAASFSQTLTGLSPGTTYNFEIAASNSVGVSYGQPYLSFTTLSPLATPTLVSPGGAAPTDDVVVSNLAPTFMWNTVSGASGYNLVIALYPSGSVVFSTSVSGTSYPIAGGILSSGTVYQWYVNAVDGVGDQSANSSLLYFNTPAPPTVFTQGATNFSNNGGSGTELTGIINPNGISATAYFDYGTTTNYGSNTPPAAIGAGTSYQNFNASIFNLGSGITYHYRLNGSNIVGLSHGADANFTTP
jgi:hypothetical protein